MTSPARAGLPPPRVYLIDNPQPNAFATGRNPENSAVAATTGLLAMLSPRRIGGRHGARTRPYQEPRHADHDRSATIAGAIASLAQFGFLFGGRGGERPNAVVILLTALIAPLAAMVIQMAISRSREYDADRMGAAILGKPHGARLGARKDRRAASPTFPTRTRNGIPPPRPSSSSTLSPGAAWTTSSRLTRRPKTGSPPCRRLPRRWDRA